jgi:signal transduction histidine kinase/CheY-like chemotaxis protein/HAMP domain-containing protein
MIFSMPIFCTSHSGQHITCVLMARINLKTTLYKMLQDRKGLGKTGELLIVNNEVVALNELLWAENAPLNLKISALPAVNAAKGKSGIAITDDYRGEPVVAAYTHIPETKWGFVCKQDMFELNAPVRELIANFITLLVLTAITIYIAATYLGTTISRPLIAMAKISAKIAGGDFSSYMNIPSRDEVGTLSQAINFMSKSIQNKSNIQNAVLNIADTVITPSNLDDYSSELLKHLMEITEANMASFYVLNELKSEFELLTSIGGNLEMMKPFSSINPVGEFGAAISNKKIIHLRDIPEDTVFTFFTTAGDIIPREIFTIPILVDNQTVALISLVNIASFSNTCGEILEQAWAGINISYSNLLANLRTEVLAENLSAINQQLEAQTEELQQQSEELQQQSEELSTTSEQLQNQNEELHMQRAQVEEANRLKSEFLSNMSHELRTPLNSIMALSNVLVDQTREKLTKEESSYLEIIERNGRQLLTLINDILDLSKIEAGQMEILPSKFSLTSLINDLVDSLRQLAAENGNTLSIEGASDTIEIVSDQSLVHRILQNLFGNAIKFTKNGSVTIQVVQNSEEISISVRDTGIGISEEELPLVFEEFRQVDGTSSRQFEGTGLGLAIAHRSAHLIGGELQVVSSLGIGSTFTVTIPRGAPQDLGSTDLSQKPLAEAPEKKMQLGHDQIRLLIVEDQEPAIIQLRFILEQVGYTVDVARDGRIALDYLKETLPDGIILDLMLPGIDGFEVLRSVRNKQASVHIPILVLSSKNLSREEIKTLRYNNIKQLIQKGELNRQELLDAIACMLDLDQQNGIDKKGAAVAEASTNKNALGNSKATILIVEDDQDSLTSLKALLKNQYSLLEAMDGKKGWELIQSQKPDLVLLDMMLPGVDGYAVAQRAKEDKQYRGIPIIAVSGRAMKGDREKMIAAGCDDYVSKPIDTNELKSKIKSWLA